MVDTYCNISKAHTSAPGGWPSLLYQAVSPVRHSSSSRALHCIASLAPASVHCACSVSSSLCVLLFYNWWTAFRVARESARARMHRAGRRGAVDRLGVFSLGIPMGFGRQTTFQMSSKVQFVSAAHLHLFFVLSSCLLPPLLDMAYGADDPDRATFHLTGTVPRHQTALWRLN